MEVIFPRHGAGRTRGEKGTRRGRWDLPGTVTVLTEVIFCSAEMNNK